MSETSILKEFRVTLETVTPLFLGGAEPRSSRLELRPPAIRGAMRYWARAIMGSISGDNLAALKNAEAKFLGNANSQNGMGSPVYIRKANDGSLRSTTFTKFIEYKSTDGKTKKRNGLSYLWFAERSTTTERERSGLTGEFDLIFSTKQMGLDGAASLLKAYGALWLLTMLGGVGNRVRRGAGCVQVKSVKILPEEIKKYGDKYPLQIQSTTTDDLAGELASGIDFVRKVYARDLKAGNIIPKTTFDILHPDVCNIYVVDKIFDSWEIALNSLGEIYKNFRMERDPDYAMIKSVKRTGNDLPQPIERSAFGLPIPLSDDMVLQSTNYDRRTSPLVFHVVKLAGKAEKYALVTIWFKSKFLPDKQEKSNEAEKLKLIEKNGSEHFGDMPNESIIETFLFGPDPVKEKASLQEKGWDLIEVSL
jgi:CRISPR-associated protein Cmr1